jgi:hypothetical protein
MRPDIAARWPERQFRQHFKLQTVSGETLPVLREVSLLTAPLTRRTRILKKLKSFNLILNEHKHFKYKIVRHELGLNDTKCSVIDLA